MIYGTNMQQLDLFLSFSYGLFSFTLKTLLWNLVGLLRVTLEFHPSGKVIAHIHTQVYTNSILAVMIDVMLPPSISIVNVILTISLLVCLTVFLSSLLFKAFNALIFLLCLFFPLLPLPGCLSYEFTSHFCFSPFFFITLIIPFWSSPSLLHCFASLHHRTVFRS